MNKLILYVCAWICLHSCGFSKSQEESMLEYALSQAGDNRKELEYVIKYYEGDSLKREAARFLIRNMVYHFGYEKRERVSDITTLSSDYLIRNIELAFQAWPKPWNKSVSFENFCRYILPYRGLYEQPSGLREELMRTYLPLLDSLHIDGIQLMRAAGIPTVAEHTIWTRRNGEHYWCAFLNEDGRFLPFAPEYEGPDSLIYNLTKPFLTPAKVYRYGFAPLHPVTTESTDEYRTFLKNPLLTAVTEQYLPPVADIHTTCDLPVRSKRAPIYLCTYNHGNWRPFAMSERIGNRCTFPKIVGDDVFIIAEYDKEAYGSLRFITSPFHVSNTGIITKIKPDPARTDSIFIASDNPYQQQVPYTLAYWEQEQQCFKNGYFPTDTIPGGILIRKIPKGSLLKAMISRPEKAAEDRIFLVENDTVKRY